VSGYLHVSRRHHPVRIE